MASLNVEQIREYNNALQTYKDQAAKLTAEIEVNNKELQRLCEELSKVLGEPVTVENIEAVYQRKVEEINNAVAQGTEVIRRIRAEEQLIKSGANERVQMSQSSFVSTPPTVAPVNTGVPANAGTVGVPANAGTPAGIGMGTQPMPVGNIGQSEVPKPPAPPSAPIPPVTFTGFDNIGLNPEGYTPGNQGPSVISL